MNSPDVDPVLTEPHLSNRVLASVVHELDMAVGEQAVDAVLGELGVSRAYVSTPEYWVSTEFVHRFAAGLARAVYGLEQLPGHDHEMWQHWRRAATRALHPDVIGPIFRVLRAFASPARFYRQVPVLHERATRRTMSEVRALGKDHVVIAVRPVSDGGVLESPNCWFQYGLFEAIPTLWGLSPAKVEHRECMLDPDHPADACVYRISFEAGRRTLDTGLLGWLVGGASAGALVGAVGLGPSLLTWALLGALAGTAVEGWRRHGRATRFAQSEVSDMSRMLRRADERQAELWKEHVALRRSMLVARKLSGYLASDLTERILQHPELQQQLGGRHTNAAVLFADVVGFTPRCERMDPGQLVEELNIYFGHVDPCIDKHRGVIDKRIGDGIMAVFVPRPEDDVDVSDRALRCAMDMLRALDACNAQLAERGAEPFQIRIGAATGELVQGNMGSDVRLEYTVIGDVVNLASRLESAAPPGTALVPRAMLERLPPDERGRLVLGEAHAIEVKGRTGRFDVIDVRPGPPAGPSDELEAEGL